LRAVEASRGVDCWDRDVEVEDGDVEVHSFFSASFPLWLIHECFLFESWLRMKTCAGLVVIVLGSGYRIWRGFPVGVWKLSWS
jgi:hypothetical protein